MSLVRGGGRGTSCFSKFHIQPFPTDTVKEEMSSQSGGGMRVSVRRVGAQPPLSGHQNIPHLRHLPWKHNTPTPVSGGVWSVWDWFARGDANLCHTSRLASLWPCGVHLTPPPCIQAHCPRPPPTPPPRHPLCRRCRASSRRSTRCSRSTSA